MNKTSYYFDALQELLGGDVIIYRPIFNRITGSLASSLLLQQALYWSKRSEDGVFYKFILPCDSLNYRIGDSWAEELDFGRRRIKDAIQRIAVRKDGKKTKGKRTMQTALLYYWQKNGVTYWEVAWDNLVEQLGKAVQEKKKEQKNLRKSQGTLRESSRHKMSPPTNIQRLSQKPPFEEKSFSSNHCVESQDVVEDIDISSEAPDCTTVSHFYRAKETLEEQESDMIPESKATSTTLSILSGKERKKVSQKKERKDQSLEAGLDEVEYVEDHKADIEEAKAILSAQGYAIDTGDNYQPDYSPPQKQKPDWINRRKWVYEFREGAVKLAPQPKYSIFKKTADELRQGVGEFIGHSLNDSNAPRQLLRGYQRFITEIASKDGYRGLTDIRGFLYNLSRVLRAKKDKDII